MKNPITEVSFSLSTAEAALAQTLLELELITNRELLNCLKHGKAIGTGLVEACVDLGHFTWEELSHHLEPQKDERFDIKTPEALLQMKDWLSCEFSLVSGAVILGMGTRRSWFRRNKSLNVGLIDTTHKEQVLTELSPLLNERGIDGVRFFSISPAEFQLALYFLYDLKKSDIEAACPTDTHPLFLLYLKAQQNI